MRRVIGITVEPHFRAINRASCKCLLDERTRHKSDFIEENTGERNSLNQRRGAFVLTAEEVESVSIAVEGYIDIVHA